MIDKEERYNYALHVIQAYLYPDFAFEKVKEGKFTLTSGSQVLFFESVEQLVGFAEGIVLATRVTPAEHLSALHFKL